MNYTEKQTLLSAAIKAIDYISDIEERKVAPSEAALNDLTLFEEPLPYDGKDALQTIDFLNQFGSPATMATAGRRYFGFVTGGTNVAALAANWMATAWDQNAALTVMSPVNATIEKIAEAWLCELLPVSKRGVVGFVTGVTMANFCALAAARTALLARQGWDVEKQGLFKAPLLKVVVSEEAHGSVLKALRMLGFGAEQLIKVPTDANGRMKASNLPRMDDTTIVCLQAGNVNTGGMDPAFIVSEAKNYGAWVHIDGAFGLWAGVSERYRHLTHGYDLADSWATDAHKLLNVPYDNGLVICREEAWLRKAMTVEGSYLDQRDQRVPYQYTPELSRRARAIDIWATIRTLGKTGIDELVTRTFEYAKQFASGLRNAGFEILNEVETNQVLVAFGSDEETLNIIEAIQQEGTCWCGATTWRGRTGMRISIASWRTEPNDVEQSLQAIIEVARKHKKQVA